MFWRSLARSVFASIAPALRHDRPFAEQDEHRNAADVVARGDIRRGLGVERTPGEREQRLETFSTLGQEQTNEAVRETDGGMISAQPYVRPATP